MKPRALFVSFFDGDATNIIKSILSLDALDLPLQKISGNIVSFPYDIDTKYYTSSVDLCTFDTNKVKRDGLCKSLVEDVQRVEAFVAYFSTNERGSFLQAAKCARFMKESNSNVKILVCDSCLSTDEISRHEILKWCIENGFELVELHDGDEKDDLDDDDDDAEEDDFRETKGVQRIVEALRCNSWSNMVLKDRSTHMSPYMKKLRDEMAESLSTTVTDNSNNNTLSECKDNTMMEESLEKLNIESCKGDVGKNSNDTEDDDSDDDEEDDDDDDPSKYMGCEEKFESLFKNIPQMREEASTLPFEERKKYAENVVKQFWCSIGGDMSEFDED